MSPNSEYNIHSIIRNYPYLLGDEFDNLDLRHERIYQDRTRADFVFTDSNLSVVVEVKKGPIDPRMLDQALHYLEKEKQENPSKCVKCLLVGTRTNKAIERKINESNYRFEVKLLGSDVPTRIKICDRCRKANALSSQRCEYCNSARFVRDPFLFTTK